MSASVLGDHKILTKIPTESMRQINTFSPKTEKNGNHHDAIETGNKQLDFT